MRRLLAAVAALVLTAGLCGCEPVYSYTDELKRDYERRAFAALEERATENGLEILAMELYAPGGITEVCVGRFRHGSQAVPYVYDSGQDVLYAAATATGFCLEDAREQIHSEISGYLEGTGLRLEGVRALSWPIAVDEHFYSVSVKDGKKDVSKVDPRISVHWMARSYFDYDMPDGEARDFVSGMLHGQGDGYGELQVALRCSDFTDPTVQEEFLSGWGLLKAFPGIQEAVLYEDGGDDRYYRLSRQDDGTVALDLYERRFAGASGGVWRKTPCALPQE